MAGVALVIAYHIVFLPIIVEENSTISLYCQLFIYTYIYIQTEGKKLLIWKYLAVRFIPEDTEAQCSAQW